MAKRSDVTVKLDADVVRIAKIVAAYREVSVAAYLSDVLLPIVQRDLEKEQRRATAKLSRGSSGES